jgi:hypothetical protein
MPWLRLSLVDDGEVSRLYTSQRQLIDFRYGCGKLSLAPNPFDGERALGGNEVD